MTTPIEAGAFRLGADRVEGPLKGYHHHAFAVHLDPGSPLAGEFGWLKLKEPRPGVFWYDMRCFSSEDRLLQELYGRVPRVPRVSGFGYGDELVTFAAFIEGATLDRVSHAGDPVAERFLAQIEELFHALAAIDVQPLSQGDLLDCGHQAPSHYTRSATFLHTLVHFSAVHAYSARLGTMDGLLADLGVRRDALRDFGEALPELTDRKPQLLHGDLHRKNFVVDREGCLWTIDWELALFGDPLYDLATHLHLMGYQPQQEQDMIRRWKRAVGEESWRGAEEDLPHYLTYKRLQSVYTDVVRGAARLLQEPGDGRLRSTSALVHKAMLAAQEPLGVEKVPPLPAIEAAFHAWVISGPELPQIDATDAAYRCQ